MEIEHPIAVSILASYFVLIFALVWRTRIELNKATFSKNSKVYLFIFLSLISLLSTWTYMFKFFIYSYNEWKLISSFKESLTLNSISLWLNDVSLFDSAWRQVSVGDWQWLWSHQLCSLTVTVWTPILAIEGVRRNIPYVWAYMLLGQVVAISVASSLFFAVMLISKPVVNKEPSSKLVKTLAMSTVGGVVTVILSPFVAPTSGFMPNLLVMHILLIFPLFNQSSQGDGREKSIVSQLVLYTVAAGSNFAIYIHQWFKCLDGLTPITVQNVYSKLIHVFFHHPAQSSISSDIVCMQLISIAWMWTYSQTEFKRVQNWVWMLIGLTPILSASVTLPVFFARIEYEKLKNDDKKKK